MDVEFASRCQTSRFLTLIQKPLKKESRRGRSTDLSFSFFLSLCLAVKKKKRKAADIKKKGKRMEHGTSANTASSSDLRAYMDAERCASGSPAPYECFHRGKAWEPEGFGETKERKKSDQRFFFFFFGGDGVGRFPDALAERKRALGREKRQNFPKPGHRPLIPPALFLPLCHVATHRLRNARLVGTKKRGSVSRRTFFCRWKKKERAEKEKTSEIFFSHEKKGTKWA